ncbi:MAG: hypothetical protein JWL80_594 [Parcubacteria group bacterium]|nr:hypothetical protein [Parcubacteria group bacterium]
MAHHKITSTRSTINSTLDTARNIAALQQSKEIGTVDLLFALNLQGDATSTILNGLFQSQGRGILPCHTPFPSIPDPFLCIDPNTVQLSRPANKVLLTAYTEAVEHGFMNEGGVIEVSTEHLLVALADVETSESRGLLNHCGIRVQSVRKAVYSWMP